MNCKHLVCICLVFCIVLAYAGTALAANVGKYVIEFQTDFSSDEIVSFAKYVPVNGEVSSFWGCIALYGSGDKLVAINHCKAVNNVAELRIEKNIEAEYAKVFAFGGITPMCSSKKLLKTDVINPVQYVDFTVEVDPAREPVILQLTDTQIIDAAQERTESRLGDSSDEYWATDKMDERCFDYLREVVAETNPDLILLTGDIIYGEFDDAGTSLLKFVEIIESFKIPWAPVFGNHDNESKKGADWQCEQFENAKYCLFKQRTLTGNGNYSVGITQDGVLKRVFFMLDSNGCGSMSAETLANGHSQKTVGFGNDQIAWYTEVAGNINKLAPDMKYSFVYHIQQEIFRTALSKYGTIDSTTIDNPINIDTSDKRADGDFGYIGRNLKSPWDTDFTVYRGMKALGCDSIFVGHEHCNSASVVYDGVRFQYGQKLSCYDRANYMKADGSYVGSYSDEGTPVMGGTVMKMSPVDGSFTDSYIYYCDTDEGYGNPGDIIVPGMKLNKEITLAPSVYGEAAYIENKKAYKFTANTQGKVFVDVKAIRNQSVFTFEAYVPSTSSAKLAGYGEFALRIKPNELEPAGDSARDGYINYNSTSKYPELKIPFDEWKTYTVDISEFGESCTELAFVIAGGNTVYLRNLAVSVQVGGLSFDDGSLKNDVVITVSTARIGNAAAHSLMANSQGKVYINTDLIKNKSTFTFDAYVPATSSAKLGGYGEFALRVKPNELEPAGDSAQTGYIDYKSSSEYEALKIPFDEWKTYTVDISDFGESCTEFAFVIAKGNTIYIKNLEIK